MLGKTSVSMMVLLAAASLIGISSIHQYIEAQTPKLQQVQKTESVPIVKGRVLFATLTVQQASKTCTATVELPGDEPNTLGLQPGTTIRVDGPTESCTLFGLSKIGNTQIQFDAQRMSPSSKTAFRATQVTL
jgi:ribosomal protein S30